jgi:hypothetical protein
MPDLEGRGTLALWNGVDPARRAEYDLWHTREHVPERLSVPGILGARRYVRTEGPLPEFLTLYSLRDTGVLRSAAYQQLLDSPTAWSRSMRGSFRGFMRVCCLRAWSVGGGAGGVLGALTLPDGVQPDDLRPALESLVAGLGLVAAHLLLRDADVPDVPFAIGGDAPDFPRGGAILLETWDEAALRQALPSVRERLERRGLGEAVGTFTCYRLAYALDQASLNALMAPPAFRPS